jgi:hypothetical protein
MIVNEQSSLAQQLEFLWKGLLPNIGVPDASQFFYWAGKYPEELIVTGINRAARKARKLRDTESPMTLVEAIQYASSVMRNENLGFRKFPNRNVTESTLEKEIA